MHNSEPYAKVQHVQFVWYIRRGRWGTV